MQYKATVQLTGLKGNDVFPGAVIEGDDHRFTPGLIQHLVETGGLVAVEPVAAPAVDEDEPEA